ncbi:hypothetical protein [Glycomyces harbinensis]|uniref:Uncharacterized protein n=1 Tax=Glycomyces harbinensis TaxID=58114 RepID=A0A1G6YB06_9ACTN|nr:hypothetical protein [Glycomyces harbinensis]SDD87578.1 hypothetical protein SAMN05216270_108237 [Glycomyces harbinensis]
MNATDTRTDPLSTLALAEDAFQRARARLKEAEADRYASIWAALTTAEDLTKLRAALPDRDGPVPPRRCPPTRHRRQPLHSARALRS